MAVQDHRIRRGLLSPFPRTARTAETRCGSTSRSPTGSPSWSASWSRSRPHATPPSLRRVTERSRNSSEPATGSMRCSDDTRWRGGGCGSTIAVDVDTDDPVQLALNLHVFHILQTISPHTAALDAGVPARGLHGEGYQGHVFWDELFVLPLYVMRTPADRPFAARLPLAATRRGTSGREAGRPPRRDVSVAERQRWPRRDSARAVQPAIPAVDAGQFVAAAPRRSRRRLQRLAVLPGHGRHLLVRRSRSGARSWRSPGSSPTSPAYDERDDRFHIRGVMGPDEYHDGYPDAPGRGAAGQRLHQRADRVGLPACGRRACRSTRSRT